MNPHVARSLQHLIGDTKPTDFVMVRHHQRAGYESRGYTYVGPVEGTIGVTGTNPMVLMQKPTPTPIPEPISDTAKREQGGVLSKFRLGLGRR